MKIFLAFIVLAFILALAVWASPGAYHAAFARAEARDLAFYRSHPDCTYEEAHRNRDRVNRLFFR